MRRFSGGLTRDADVVRDAPACNTDQGGDTPGAAQSAEAGTASAPAEEFNYGRFAELAAVILRGLPVLSAQLLAP